MADIKKGRFIPGDDKFAPYKTPALKMRPVVINRSIMFIIKEITSRSNMCEITFLSAIVNLVLLGL